MVEVALLAFALGKSFRRPGRYLF